METPPPFLLLLLKKLPQQKLMKFVLVFLYIKVEKQIFFFFWRLKSDFFSNMIDIMQQQIGACAEEDIAAAVVSPVVAIHKDRGTFTM